MERRNFPLCCALDLLTGFGNTSSAIDQTQYTPAQVSRFLGSQSSYGVLMILLNSEQMKVIGKQVRAAGFKTKARFYYGGHGNNIYVLMRIPETNKFKHKISK